MTPIPDTPEPPQGHVHVRGSDPTCYGCVVSETQETRQELTWLDVRAELRQRAQNLRERNHAGDKARAAFLEDLSNDIGVHPASSPREPQKDETPEPEGCIRCEGEQFDGFICDGCGRRLVCWQDGSFSWLPPETEDDDAEGEPREPHAALIAEKVYVVETPEPDSKILGIFTDKARATAWADKHDAYVETHPLVKGA